ncbi:MAG: ribosomal L7Ae/L30e/S12e/Gadd45 family protein [Clostridia bacterium]|nr:ribosomal L7Ae/L30e/S12e/Gadd45 family protein [Clostridia bacterium]
MDESYSDPMKKTLSCLGLCVRAGKVIFGVPQIVEAMRRGGAAAPVTVFEAADTSENTHKRISDKCKTYQTRHIRLTVDGTTLAAALGKTSSLGAVAVTDRRMSDMVEAHLPDTAESQP